MRKLSSAILLGVVATGCSGLKMSRVRPDYDQVDRQKTKRLAVVTQPLPDENPKLGDLWSLIARRYVNQKRNFIAKKNVALPASPAFDPKNQCEEGIEGVLWISPTVVRRQGSRVKAAANGTLLRCVDGEEVWAARAEGRWASQDRLFAEATAQYENEIGPEVSRYVAPTFRVLKALLDSLPDPVLDEQDVNEKIELGE